MTVATVQDFETRIKALEADVALLKDQLEFAQSVASINRGIDAANAGDLAPADVVFDRLRQYRKLPHS